MSRRIGEDFKAFSDFLQNYNLSSFNSTQKQTDEYRAMHKKLFGLLIFSAEYKTQNIQKGNELFFTEMSSDLLISLFCAAQGLYKPAKLQLRCSIENFLKAMIIFDTPTIVQEKEYMQFLMQLRVIAIFSAHLGNG